MTDKVQKIKKEIEKKRQLIWPTNTGEMKVVDTPNQLIQGWLNCLKWIEDFINSLPEESESKDRINECPHWEKYWGCETSPMNNCDSCPQAKWVEVKEEKKNYNERYKRLAQTEQFKKSYCDKSLGKDEPTSKDLEEAAQEYSFNIPTQLEADSVWKQETEQHFKDGAKWHKQQDEKLFNDDSWNYIEENYPNITQEEKFRLYDISIKSRLAGANTIKQHMKEALQTEYEKGLYDMREEMMKNVVEGISCTYSNKSGTFLHIKNGLDTKNGDKVKIIIVKEEQQ